MVKWRYYKSALAMMVIALSLAPLAGIGNSLAQDPGQPGLPTVPSPKPITGRAEPEVSPSADLDVFQETGPVNIIVRLEETPLAMIMGEGDGQAQGAAVRDQIARIEAAQTSALDAMTAQNIPYDLIGKTSRVLSTVIIRADASQLDAIRNLPGVAQVAVERIGHYDNSSTVPYIQTPSAWVEGYTGAGMSVGLIDSGIDYDHLDFGGDGDQIPEKGTGLDYPSVKVAEGYDFVGNGWQPGDPLIFDDDPYDEYGHGTHIAGTIAGYGVLSGSTYPGPWDNTTPFATMTVGPGVAPEAVIYPLKVGGPSDDVSEAATILALEFATDPNYDDDTSDHLDVVIMAFGSNFGDPESDWSTAVNNAAQLGIVVVAPAGNSGDTYFIQGAPGTADWALSVGASFDGINADHLASFSSRGPQQATTGPAVGLKPDITAPGGEVTSAALGTGSAATTMGGTSMAAAHVAGAVALLRQQHPTWSVAEIKALAMNTAIHLLTNGSDYFATGRVGAGRLDVSSAIDSDVIAYNTTDPELVGVSWGVQDADSSSNQLKTITIKNKGTTQAVLNVTYDALADVPGVSFTVDPPTVTIPGGGTQTVNVTLNIDPAAMTVNPHTHAPTVIEQQYGDPRHWLSEESGLVHLARVSGPVPELIWVPVYAAVRPASTLESTVNPISVAGITGSTTIDMTGTAVHTGTDVPYDIISKVSAFDLVIESTDDPSPDAEGVFNAADIEYVGITSDYNAVIDGGGTFSANGKVYFGISTYGQWSSLSDTAWFEVFIDSDRDSTFDYKVYNWNNGSPFGSSPSDSLVVIVKNLHTHEDFLYPDMWVNHYPAVETATSGGSFDIGLDTAVFQNRVMFMGMWASAIGLSDADADFDYYVQGNYGSEIIETTAVKTYDASVQGLEFSGGTPGAPLHTDAVGPSVPVSWDWSIYQGSDPPCALLLHHHNTDALRAEKVCFNPNITGDVSVEKTTTTVEAYRGETVVYDLTVHNDGPDTAGSVVLVDDLPDSLIYVSAVPTTGTCDETSGLVECDLGDFANGQTETVTLTVVVGVSTAGPLYNMASVSFNGYDPNSANNSSTESFTYLPQFCDPVTEIPLYECDALEAFYDDTDGPNWTHKSGWVTTTTPCSWYGVTCAADHVTSLELSNNALSGAIPTVLDELDNLIILDLSQNALTGAMPSAIVDMASLQYLYLNGNQINDLPVELPTMSGLLRLRLNTNLLTGNDTLVDLTAMTNLTELDLGNNALGGTIPATLSDMTALRTLKLNDAGLTGTFPTEVASLTLLQTLNLGGNQFTGAIPSLIGGLTDLQGLMLNGNQFEGAIPTEIGNLINLNTLKLQNNALGDNVPSTIMNLTGLGYNQLDLGYNMLTPPSTTVRSFLNTKDPDWLLTQTVPPTGVSASAASTTSVKVSWSPIFYRDDGGYYEVEYKLASGGTFAFGCTSVDKYANNCVVEGLEVATTYKFRVRTYTPAHGDQQNDLWSNFSNEVFGTSFTILVDPTGLAAVGAAGNQINLSWTDPNVDETGYAIERSPDGVSDWTEVGITAPNATSHEDIGLFCELPYYYRVRAYRSVDGEYSGYSNIANATTLECPTNLVRNPDFSADEAEWSFFGEIWHDVISGEVLTIYRMDPSPTGAAVWQMLQYTPPPDSSFEVNIDIANTSSGPKEMWVTLRQPDWSDFFTCYFSMAADTPLTTVTMFGHTTSQWSDMLLEIAPSPADGVPAIKLDNISVEYRDDLNVQETSCIASNLPPSANLAVNSGFGSGTDGWTFWGEIGYTWNPSGDVSFYREDPSPVGAAIYQDLNYTTLANAPFEVTADLANDSDVVKDVWLTLRSPDWTDYFNCRFTLEPNAPMTNYTMRGRSTTGWSGIRIEIVPGPADGIPATRVDNVTVRHKPSLPFFITECVRSAVPENEELVRNGDFSAGDSDWYTWGDIERNVSGGVMNFWRSSTVTAGGAVNYQDLNVQSVAGKPFEVLADLGNSSGVDKQVWVTLRNYDWSDYFTCYFEIPAGAPLTTYKLRGETSLEWSNMRLEFWVGPPDGVPALQLDNVSVINDPSLSPVGVECEAPNFAPADTNLVRNPDFAAGESEWSFWGQIGHSVVAGVLEIYREITSPQGATVFQDLNYALFNSAPVEVLLDLGNSSAVAKEVWVTLRNPDWSEYLTCYYSLPASASAGTYSLLGTTINMWDNARLEVTVGPADGVAAVTVDNVSVMYRPSLSPSGVECGTVAGATGEARRAEPPNPEDSLLPTPTPTVETTPQVVVETIESDDPRVVPSGEWIAHASELASGGSYLFSSGSAEDTLSLDFDGSAATVVYVGHPALGSFAVEVDGAVMQTVNSATQDAVFGEQVAVTGLAEGAHTLRIVPVSGTVAIDAFVIETQTDAPVEPTPTPTALPTDGTPTVTPTVIVTEAPTATPAEDLETIESDDARVTQAGAWTVTASELASGGSYLFSSGSPADTLSLTFTGLRVDVVYVKHPALGMFSIEVDGAILYTVDSATSEAAFGASVALNGLGEGVHTLRIMPVSGTIAIDAFVVERQGEVPVQPSPTLAPTVTPVDPGETPVPTVTPVEPTATEPPTVTPVPPTATPVPPTATSVPPTATPVPPTETGPSKPGLGN